MKKRNFGNVLILAGVLLIAAALVFAGINKLQSLRAEKAAASALEWLRPEIGTPVVPPDAVNNGTGEASEETEYPDYVLNPEMDMPVAKTPQGEYVGILEIPALSVELPVFSEWDYEKLRISPCRFSGSAYRDDLVICAHNYDNHFGGIKNLRYGDAVTFTDVDGNIFSYEVTEIEQLAPESVDDMTAGEHALTLFTCTLGGAARVTIRCDSQR